MRTCDIVLITAKNQNKKKSLGPTEWIVSSIVVLLVGGFLFVEIATMINPNFFAKTEDNSSKVESIRNKISPKTKLPETLLLNNYTLKQTSYYSNEHPTSLEEPDRFNRIITGELQNKGDSIPAWSLHLSFDVYDLDEKKADGAYCIVQNGEEIAAGKTWKFDAIDNLDDCFPEVSHGTKIDINKYVVVYRDYDLEK